MNSELSNPMNTTMGMNAPTERRNGRAPFRKMRYAPANAQVITT